MKRYTARQDWLVYGNECCGQCGQVPEQHHSDTRCYTVEEIGARLRFRQRAGRWPGPDEGCTLEDADVC